MGIIDSAKLTLTCPSCGLIESDRVLDKGNPFGGSSWQTPSFKEFKAAVTGGGKDDPEVAATCPKCGVAAKVETKYGG